MRILAQISGWPSHETPLRFYSKMCRKTLHIVQKSRYRAAGFCCGRCLTDRVVLACRAHMTHVYYSTKYTTTAVLSSQSRQEYNSLRGQSLTFSFIPRGPVEMRLEQDFPSHYDVRLALTCWAKAAFDVLHPLDGVSPAAATSAGGVAGGPQPAHSLQSCATVTAPRSADESNATLTCPAVSGGAIAAAAAAAGPSQPPVQQLPEHDSRSFCTSSELNRDGFWGAAPPTLPQGHMQQHDCSPAHAELHSGQPVQPFAAQQHLLLAAPPLLQHHQLRRPACVATAAARPGRRADRRHSSR